VFPVENDAPTRRKSKGKKSKTKTADKGHEEGQRNAWGGVFWSPLTAAGLDSIAAHKYVGGKYTPVDNLMNPFWYWATDFLPVANQSKPSLWPYPNPNADHNLARPLAFVYA
jgi:hypothetical protein